MDLTVSQLECFVAAIDAGSFTGAADRIDVSQPAVAEQVQRLEAAIGQSLFARVARGVRPTAAALELEPHARRALEAVQAANSVARHVDEVGAATITFGTFGSPHHYRLADLIARFLSAYPGARVRIVGRNSSSTANAVRDGSLDAAIVALPIDDRSLDVDPLFTAEVFFVSSDPRATRRAIGIGALARRPLILYEASAGASDPTRLQLAARAQAAGVVLEPRIEVESADVALQLAAAGLGDTYVPEILRPMLDPRLATVAFDPPLVDTFALITRAGARISRPIDDFIRRVSEHLLTQIGPGHAVRSRSSRRKR